MTTRLTSTLAALFTLLVVPLGVTACDGDTAMEPRANDICEEDQRRGDDDRDGEEREDEDGGGEDGDREDEDRGWSDEEWQEVIERLEGMCEAGDEQACERLEEVRNRDPDCQDREDLHDA